MTTLAPQTESQLIEAVRWAVAAEQPLELLGRGSKRGFGRPVQAAHTLDLSRLSGIVSYEPEELLLVVKPGTTRAELSAVLAERRQMLAFDPPDLSPLWGGPAGAGTVGGLVSAGLSGPRRLKAGAVRDHVLGISAVSGRGDLFRAGGKVVKNVTGYDLPKLLTGALGTLGTLTEIVLKVLPAPEMTRTLVLAGIDGAAAHQAMADALGSPAEVAAAAWVPAGIPWPGLPPRTPCVLLRLEGVAVSVESRLGHLGRLLEGRAATAVLEAEDSAMLWTELRDAAPLARQPERAVWKLSVPPMQGMAVLDRIRTAVPGSIGWLDWAGGLVWVGLPDGDARAGLVRGAMSGEGHATLMRAADGVRATVPVFQPQPEPLARLTARVKAQFDPKGILNPGRMAAGG